MSEPAPGHPAGGAVPAPGPAAPTPGPAARTPGPAAAPTPGPGVPVTGDEAVDEALRRLTGVEDHDLRSQVSAFEDVHGALQDRLADAEG